MPTSICTFFADDDEVVESERGGVGGGRAPRAGTVRVVNDRHLVHGAPR
jgi:hypothetical protein